MEALSGTWHCTRVWDYRHGIQTGWVFRDPTIQERGRWTNRYPILKSHYLHVPNVVSSRKATSNSPELNLLKDSVYIKTFSHFFPGDLKKKSEVAWAPLNL